MSVPVWLLDVDGVLNAGQAGWGRAPVKRPIVSAEGFRFDMRFEPQVMSAIIDLHGRGLVSVYWSTTWVEECDQLSELFGLPRFPPAFRLSDGAVPDLKVLTALQVVADGRRLIWTDDEAIPVGGPLRARLEAAGALLIAPRPSRGLRPDHVEAIRRFVEEGSNG